MRTATAADVPAVRALVERAYRGDAARGGWTHEADLLDGQRTDEAALRDMLADPAQALLLAEEDGAITGCVTVRGGEPAYLGMLTVDPARQGGGLGARLLAAAERHAAAAGSRAMEMTVIVQRAELIAWYERRGWRRTGEERPFPYGDERFGLPRRGDLRFAVLAKRIVADDFGDAFRRAKAGAKGGLTLGWRLPADARAMLLARFPPRYPDLFAHHVTLAFGAAAGAALPPERDGMVVGRADDGSGLEALVVAISGATDRPDGSTFHITWSLDAAAGRRPVHSNDVIRKRGWTPLAEPIAVALTPALMD